MVLQTWLTGLGPTEGPQQAERDDAKQSRLKLVQPIRLRAAHRHAQIAQRVERDFAQAQMKVGRDRLFHILRQARLLVVPLRAYHKTTQSHHRFQRHPNLLKKGPDQVVPNGAEQVWVADITYLPTRGKFAYLSLVTDAWSRKIVGYHVHGSLQTKVSEALKMALHGRRGSTPVIHHSDRGIQYNQERPHMALKYKTPDEVHQASLA